MRSLMLMAIVSLSLSAFANEPAKDAAAPAASAPTAKAEMKDAAKDKCAGKKGKALKKCMAGK